MYLIIIINIVNIIEAVVAQRHKGVSVNATLVDSIPSQENEFL